MRSCECLECQANVGVCMRISTLWGHQLLMQLMSVLLTTSHPCVRRSITIKKGNKSEEKGLNTF